nr:MAG TPA: hypothetical protein [Caudoviricetes sp.]
MRDCNKRERVFFGMLFFFCPSITQAPKFNHVFRTVNSFHILTYEIICHIQNCFLKHSR